MKKENHPKLQKKEASKARILNLPIINIKRKGINLMFVGARMQMRIFKDKIYDLLSKVQKARTLDT